MKRAKYLYGSASRIVRFKKLFITLTKAKGYMYILKCSDDTYYTGSTKYLEKRIEEHQNGKGANYTKKKLPIQLIYFEEYRRIDYAFNREK